MMTRLFLVACIVLAGAIGVVANHPGVNWAFDMDGVPTAQPLYIDENHIVSCVDVTDGNYTYQAVMSADPTTYAAFGIQLDSTGCSQKPIKSGRNTVVFFSREEAGEMDVDEPNNWKVWALPRYGNAEQGAVNEAGSIVFVPTGTGQEQNLTAVDIGSNGNVLWTFHAVPGEHIYAPVTHEGSVFFITGPYLKGLDGATGAKVFDIENPCGITDRATVVVAETKKGLFALLVYGTVTDEKSVICRIHHTSGQVEWTTSVDGYISRTLAGEGYVFFIEFFNRGLHALDATTGTELFNKVVDYGDFRCTPVATENMFIASLNNTLTCLSLYQPFNVIWTKPNANCSMDLVANNGSTYVVNYPDDVRSYDSMSGELQWTVEGDVYYPPVFTEQNNVILQNTFGELVEVTKKAAPTTPSPFTSVPGTPNPPPGPQPTPPAGLGPTVLGTFSEGGTATANSFVMPTGWIVNTVLDSDGQPLIDFVNFTNSFGNGFYIDHPVLTTPQITANYTAVYWSTAVVGEMDPGYGIVWETVRDGNKLDCAVDEMGTYVFCPVGAQSNRLDAMALENRGQAAWSHVASKAVGTPVVHEEKVFFSDGDSVYGRVQNSGKRVFAIPQPCGLTGSIQLKVIETTSGLYALIAYGASADGGIVCRIHHTTGVAEWAHDFDYKITRVGGGANSIFIGDEAFGLNVLNAATGAHLFTLSRSVVKDWMCMPYAHEYEVCSGDTCQSKGILYYSVGGTLVARDLGGANEVLFELPNADCRAEPVVFGEELLITTVGSALTSYNFEVGSINWVAYIPIQYTPNQYQHYGVDAIVATADNGDVYVYKAKSQPIPITPTPGGAAPPKGDNGGVSGGAVAAIVIVLTLVFGGAFGFYVYKTKGRYFRRSAGVGESTNLQGKYDEIPDN